MFWHVLVMSFGYGFIFIMYLKLGHQNKVISALNHFYYSKVCRKTEAKKRENEMEMKNLLATLIKFPHNLDYLFHFLYFISNFFCFLLGGSVK